MRVIVNVSKVPSRLGSLDLEILDSVSPDFILILLRLHFGAKEKLAVSSFPHIEQWWDVEIDGRQITLHYDEAWGMGLSCYKQEDNDLICEIQNVLERTSRWSPLRFGGSLAYIMMIPFRIPRMK